MRIGNGTGAGVGEEIEEVITITHELRISEKDAQRLGSFGNFGIIYISRHQAEESRREQVARSEFQYWWLRCW